MRSISEETGSKQQTSRKLAWLVSVWIMSASLMFVGSVFQSLMNAGGLRMVEHSNNLQKAFDAAQEEFDNLAEKLGPAGGQGKARSLDEDCLDRSISAIASGLLAFFDKRRDCFGKGGANAP